MSHSASLLWLQVYMPLLHHHRRHDNHWPTSTLHDNNNNKNNDIVHSEKNVYGDIMTKVTVRTAVHLMNVD